MDFIAEHQPVAEKAKDIIFDLFEFKIFLISSMKTQNIEIPEGVASVMETTTQTFYQYDAPRGVKLLAILETILKALTAKFGLSQASRDIIRTTVTGAMSNKDVENITVETRRIKDKIDSVKELTDDPDILWLTTMYQVKAQLNGDEKDEEIRDFVERFNGMILETLEELAMMKSYGRLGKKEEASTSSSQDVIELSDDE